MSNSGSTDDDDVADQRLARRADDALEPAAAAKFREQMGATAKAQRARGVPHNTERAYRADWEQFEFWCQKVGYPALPTTEEALCGFLTHLSIVKRVRKLKKKPHRGKEVEGFAYQPSSIERKLTAVVKEHKKARLESPRTEQVSAQMHSIWMDRDTRPKKAAPLLGHHLKAIATKMATVISEGVTLRDVALRDRAVLLIGWHCALRRSEVTNLKLSSIELLDGGVTVYIGRSKTDQKGKGRTLWIKPVRSNPQACPVAALRAWLQHRGEKPGALFWHADWSDLSPEIPMPAWQVTTVIDRWVRLAAVEPESKDTEFSPHSLRAGFITHAMRRNRKSEDVMRHSGHKSHKVFMGYVHVATGFENTVQGDILDD